MPLLQEDIKRLEDIKLYISSNLEKDLKLFTLAQRFGLEIHTLRRQFKRHFGSPVHCYIREKRMIEAMGLLREKLMPVNEVARAVGYQDVSTFSHAFSAYFGVCPNSFLK